MPRRPISLHLLIALLIFLSLGALICGAMIMIAPDGSLIGLSMEIAQHMPFPDFFIPGLCLFLFLGVLPLIAAITLMPQHTPTWIEKLNIYRDYCAGWMLALFSGFGTLIWITVQHQMTQTFHVLQTIYAAVGLLILVMALWPATMRCCRIA